RLNNLHFSSVRISCFSYFSKTNYKLHLFVYNLLTGEMRVTAKLWRPLSSKPNPMSITSDYIGPPDKESNLRPYVRHIPPNETSLEKRLRESRIMVEEWNHEFWSRHNKRFYEEKEEFLKLHKTADDSEVSADKLSEFYKSFLDKNHKIHLLYNISWYCKNFDLLILATQVNIHNFLLKLKKKR
uniref:Apoptogenic protein 1, mitochondrial n=1 Tax=Megaselia scalaris TaxID=36166 RepID=T1GQV5_MEGSC